MARRAPEPLFPGAENSYAKSRRETGLSGAPARLLDVGLAPPLATDGRVVHRVAAGEAKSAEDFVDRLRELE